MTTTATEKQTFGDGFFGQTFHPSIKAWAAFDHDSRKWVAILTRFQGQPIEVYAVLEGMEMFAGYLTDLVKTSPKLAVAACEALSS
jgi:hypothetical protein